MRLLPLAGGNFETVILHRHEANNSASHLMDCTYFDSSGGRGPVVRPGARSPRHRYIIFMPSFGDGKESSRLLVDIH